MLGRRAGVPAGATRGGAPEAGAGDGGMAAPAGPAREVGEVILQRHDGAVMARSLPANDAKCLSSKVRRVSTRPDRAQAAITAS